MFRSSVRPLLSLSRMVSRMESVSLSSKPTMTTAIATTGDEASQGQGGLPKRTLVPIIPLETSLRYMKSQGYKDTYGDRPVWVPYRRNFKGQFAPKRTRRACIKKGYMETGNPCPICRDQYLVLDPLNVSLLKQFISPFNGELLPTTKTNICQAKHFQLRIVYEKAKDLGTISFDVPFREYDYSDWTVPEESKPN